MAFISQDSTRTVSISPSLVTGPYLAGELIADRYRLARELGRGGMGVVWAAQSLALGVDVAVKLIHVGAASSLLASRMGREAHIAARLAHPALVRVFDFGWTQRNDPFLVMELAQGETLRVVLEREAALPAIQAVKTLLPIADGLRVAHERGIVHRDIKPDNILLASDALNRVQPKLLDFGIAKLQAMEIGRLTAAGSVVGSPEYMSPEQAKGLETIDARTDVWSLCATLYELVTGHLPFAGANYNALMCAILTEPVSTPEASTVGDTQLWEIIERGLRKEPNERWADMGQLGEALALWLYQHGVKEDVCGNSLRAVWLDTFPGPQSPGPSQVARDSWSARAGARLPLVPTSFAWLRPLAFVTAIAAAVFGLFELTFAGGTEPSYGLKVSAPNRRPIDPTGGSNPLAPGTVPVVLTASEQPPVTESIEPDTLTPRKRAARPSAPKRKVAAARDFGF